MNARRFLLVVLPICISGVIGFAFWKVHHPPKTEQDVEFEKIVSSCPARVYLYSAIPQQAPATGSVGVVYQSRIFIGTLTPSELSSVADQSYVNEASDPSNISIDSRSSVRIEFTQPQNHYLYLHLDPRRHLGIAWADGLGKMRRSQALYPLSVQAWTRFLVAHPRVGPAIRHRFGLA